MPSKAIQALSLESQPSHYRKDFADVIEGMGLETERVAWTI